MGSDRLLNFRCPADLLETVEARAKSLNQSKSEVVVAALRAAFNLPEEEELESDNHINASWVPPNPFLAALEERLSAVEAQLKIDPAKLPGEYGDPRYSLGVKGHLSLTEAYVYAKWRYQYQGTMASFALLSADKLRNYGIEYWHTDAQTGTEFRPYQYSSSCWD